MGKKSGNNKLIINNNNWITISLILKLDINEKKLEKKFGNKKQY